jgi:hypothetical protein
VSSIIYVVQSLLAVALALLARPAKGN